MIQQYQKPAVADPHSAAGAGATEPNPLPVAPASIPASVPACGCPCASDRHASEERRSLIIVVKYRDERATPADIHPGRANRGHNRAGTVHGAFNALSTARDEWRVLRWSARSVLTPLVLNFCGLLTRWSFPRIEFRQEPSRGLTKCFEVLSLLAVHRRQSSTKDFVNVRKGFGEIRNV